MAETTGPLISVRGEAAAEVEPELAHVVVTVVARDRDRDRVLRDLDERVRSVDALLDRFSTAIERVDTEAVRVAPQFATNKPREKVAGYEASVRRTVVLHDFSPLGDLLAQLAVIDLAAVTGPTWTLRPASEVTRDVRVAAVRDAVHRAQEYAEALGCSLTELVDLADVGLMTSPEARAMAVSGVAATAFRGAPVPETFSFDVTPTRQVVEASVEARFRATPPDLS